MFQGVTSHYYVVLVRKKHLLGTIESLYFITEPFFILLIEIFEIVVLANFLFCFVGFLFSFVFCQLDTT